MDALDEHQLELGGEAAPAPAASSSSASAPSEEQLKKERQDKARADNLARGRAAKAEKAAAQALADKRQHQQLAAEKKADKEEKPTVSSQTLKEGAKLLVRLCWLLATLFSRVAGYSVRKLTAEELDEGVEEALPMLRRWSIVAKVLSFLGFPLWLGSKVHDLAERIAPAKKPAPPAPAPNNVHQLHGSGTP